MTEPIEFWGIETNNLKNIDVKIYKNSLNLIIGPSGSGKSSLAYDTIAQIGQHEYLSMFADNIEDPAYKLKGYKNMINLRTCYSDSKTSTLQNLSFHPRYIRLCLNRTYSI